MTKGEFKGTKGKFYTKYVNGLIRIVDKYDNNVLDTPFIEINESNALLISKSPEMLETIKELLKELEFHGYQHSTTIYKANELIKEATEL